MFFQQNDSLQNHANGSASAPVKPLANTRTSGKIKTLFVEDDDPGDTLLSVSTEKPVVSIFTGHELTPKNNTSVEKLSNHPAWLTLLLMVVLIIIAYAKVNYQKKLSAFFRAASEKRFAQQLMREENALTDRLSIFLLLVFFATFSVFIYKLLLYFQPDIFGGNNFLLFIKVFFVIVFIFFLKIFLLRFAGFLFLAEGGFAGYIFNIFLYNKMLGIAFIPVVAGIFYASPALEPLFIYSGIALFAAAYMMKLTRGLTIGISIPDFNIVYLFFYLCTLEILPAVVLTKIILGN